MEQEALFIEDELEALKVDIARLGGMKVVGASLYPDKTPPAAGEYLGACLNADRREKLDYSQIIWIKSEARKVGSFAAHRYESQVCGFAEPIPIEPEDEAAKLQRQFNESVKLQQQILHQMQRIQLPTVKAVSE
jgi:hypothetical protein